MDERRPDMRVSDADRQAAAERLRLALGEGRLDLLEYDDRLGRAFAAVTYADLDVLFTDLPPASAMSRPAAPPALGPGPERPAPSVARLPTALKVLWTVWVAVVSINVTVWVLVSVTHGDPVYFWPMWLVVPGVALFGVSVGLLGVRAHRPELPPPPEPPPPPTPGA